MKTVLISSAVVLSAISVFILFWHLFSGSGRTEPQINLPSSPQTAEAPKVLLWDSMWVDEAVHRDRTNIGWLFCIPRHFYDPEFRKLLLSRKWRNGGAAAGFNQKQQQRGDKAPRDFDGMREKRASSIVTYFCIFVLVLSLIRAALDMNRNLKKSREDNDNQTINLDSRRCSLNDFKLAQAHLKKKEQSQRRACLLRRAMTIVENPSTTTTAAAAVATTTATTTTITVSLDKPSSAQSMNNLDAKEAIRAGKDKLEKQNSVSEGSSTDSPTKLRPRFSSQSPTPPHLRRMSFPALRRGSSMDVVHADMDDLIAHHSPEVKRRMRLLRH